MHVMFVHPAFPAQFGHIAQHLASQLQWPCTFVTSMDTTAYNLPYARATYKVYQGQQPALFQNPRDLQALIDHANAIYQSMKTLPQVQPNLVVGHMFYGTILFLRNLYDCPFIGYFDMMPPPFWGDGMILRKEYPPPDHVRLYNAVYHTFSCLHLHAVEECYTPTYFQRSTAPPELQHKIRVIHDGIDVDFFQPRAVQKPIQFHGVTIGKDTRVVTYVARGLESVRGFDIFMKVAKNIQKEMGNVLFLVCGNEETHYGHDIHFLPRGTTFKQLVLSQDNYDLSNFHFLNWIPKADLARLYNLSDLHFYLTVPYVLSWSMIQAMASSCNILGSATPPVQEAVDDGVHALLADFYDVDGMTTQALKVLKDPGQFKPLGQAARARVLERYEARRCLAELVKLFQSYQGKKALVR